MVELEIHRDRDIITAPHVRVGRCCYVVCSATVAVIL